MSQCPIYLYTLLPMLSFDFYFLKSHQAIIIPFKPYDFHNDLTVLHHFTQQKSHLCHSLDHQLSSFWLLLTLSPSNCESFFAHLLPVLSAPNAVAAARFLGAIAPVRWPEPRSSSTVARAAVAPVRSVRLAGTGAANSSQIRGVQTLAPQQGANLAWLRYRYRPPARCTVDRWR